jgi:ComF family protein
MFLEKIMGFVAPHYCVICGSEGAVICPWCLPDLALPLPARCYHCRAVTKDSLVCSKCRRTSRIKHVWVRTTYDGPAKQLIHEFKFQRKVAAAQPIAELMAEALPYLPPQTIITHVPTASSRVRRRGYDHAQLLAKALAERLGLTHQTLLLRTTQTRQVGSKRAVRLAQMQTAFQAHKRVVPKSTVLLVDDLTTTGATLEVAAKTLKKAGVKTVDAIVFAQK